MSDYYDLPKDSTFLASSKAVIFNEKNEILMVQTAKSDFPWSEKWGFPGGLVEFNESLTDAVKREAKEELGIEVEIEDVFAAGSYFVTVPFTFRDGRVMTVKIVGVAFKCRLKNPEETIKLSDEHGGFDWIPVSKVTSLKLSGDSMYITRKLSFAS